MGKEGIGRLSNLLALSCHHVHGVVQKDAANLSRSFRHKNTCSWKPSHYHGQRADVVLMRVRNQDCFDVPAGDRLEVRQRVLACVLWMHPAIEHQPVAADLKVVRVRANLRAACQVNEFQGPLLLLLLLLLVICEGRICGFLLTDAGADAADETHQHRNDFEELCLPGNDCLNRGQTLRH